MISEVSLVANCYAHPWVTGVVGALFVALGVVIIRHRSSVARTLVSDFILSWWHPSPDERQSTVALYTKIASIMLGLFGGWMILVSVLAFAGNLACQS